MPALIKAHGLQRHHCIHMKTIFFIEMKNCYYYQILNILSDFIFKMKKYFHNVEVDCFLILRFIVPYKSIATIRTSPAVTPPSI